ncbi:MAG: substrate-binding domain-containing protein [Rickettsiales bacterium]|nr:substrate-binding domain-containing protein [Rickettsiales bacterium]
MLRILLLIALFTVNPLLPKLAFGSFFSAHDRAHIQIVGSSTVYPFTAVIAETFGRNSAFKTPIVESTGTGGGFKLFCSGVGFDYPDLSNASRKIKQSEIEKCAINGIKNVGEIKVGYDGIVLANSVDGEYYSLTKKEVFLALADQVPSKNNNSLIANPYKKWSDLNKRLPAIEIAVYGPPPTSGTRDAFVELVMEKACKDLQAFKTTYADEKIRKKKCHLIRNDGHFIEAGENDNLIVQKLKNNHNALGIFGFSFLEENRHVVKPVTINKVVPTFESIVKGSYPVSRPLFIYYKKEHLPLIKGINEFLEEIVSKNTIGNDGYLMQKGLIPLTDSELKDVRNKVLKSL